MMFRLIRIGCVFAALAGVTADVAAQPLPMP